VVVENQQISILITPKNIVRKRKKKPIAMALMTR